MNQPATPLFCGIELATRVERVEAQMIVEATRATRRGAPLVMRLAGGAATFAQPGSPMNKVVGLGFGGVPGADELAAVERAFAERSCPVQVELSNLADPGVGRMLTERGYRLVGFENVLGAKIGKVAPWSTEVEIGAPEKIEEWINVMVEGFATPDGHGVQSSESFPRELIAQTMGDLAAAGGFVPLVARRAGVVAGGASFRIAEGIAQLTGAATLAGHRGRGVHTALLAARLREAGAAGCDIATITTSPGSKSQENAVRHGFSLLYTRAVLVK